MLNKKSLLCGEAEDPGMWWDIEVELSTQIGVHYYGYQGAQNPLFGSIKKQSASAPQLAELYTSDGMSVATPTGTYQRGDTGLSMWLTDGKDESRSDFFFAEDVGKTIRVYYTP